MPLLIELFLTFAKIGLFTLVRYYLCHIHVSGRILRDNMDRTCVYRDQDCSRHTYPRCSDQDDQEYEEETVTDRNSFGFFCRNNAYKYSEISFVLDRGDVYGCACQHHLLPCGKRTQKEGTGMC